MSHSFDAEYYRSGCGPIPYERRSEWLAKFDAVADAIVKSLAPRTAFDAGCAMGFLVEALRKRNVEAWGVDISDYAISQAHISIAPYVRVGSITDALSESYDLVTCIEVVEHMPETEATQAIASFCSRAQYVLFSSSPDDHSEPTHINVQQPGYWAALFAEHRFYRDFDFDASVVTPWAALFRRTAKQRTGKEILAAYENGMLKLSYERDRLAASEVQLTSALHQAKQELESLRALNATRLPTLKQALARMLRR